MNEAVPATLPLVTASFSLGLVRWIMHGGQRSAFALGATHM